MVYWWSFFCHDKQKSKICHSSTISPTQFAHIWYCTMAKQAWDKLRILLERDKQVRDLKLHMILSKFEDLRMKESESFSAFYEKSWNVDEWSLTLGKAYWWDNYCTKDLENLAYMIQSKKGSFLGVSKLIWDQTWKVGW